MIVMPNFYIDQIVAQLGIIRLPAQRKFF